MGWWTETDRLCWNNKYSVNMNLRRLCIPTTRAVQFQLLSSESIKYLILLYGKFSISTNSQLHTHSCFCLITRSCYLNTLNLTFEFYYIYHMHFILIWRTIILKFNRNFIFFELFCITLSTTKLVYFVASKDLYRIENMLMTH